MKPVKPIRVNKIELPKMWNGGAFQDLDPQKMLGGAQSIIPGQDAEPQLPSMENQYGVTFEGDTGPAKGTTQAVSGIKTALSAIPVWGQIAAIGMGIGDKIGASTKDEFGVYKSKGASAIDHILSPTTQVSGLIDTFKDPSLENIGNTLSMGLIGTSSRQKELERLKKRYEYDVTARGTSMNQEAGDTIKNSLPVYQAPRYGKDGLKLSPTGRYKSKFSKFK